MRGDELQRAVDALPHWYHRVSLPGGVVTPGWAPLDQSIYRLPADLTGKRVLDVGAWDGYWTFEALKRGAERVVAIDDFSNAIYKGERRGWEQFDLCRGALGYDESRCDRMELSVYDVDKAFWNEHFDVVLFFGVLYHLKHPLLALEKLAAVTREMICVESAVLDHYSPYLDGTKEPFKAGGYGDRMVMEFYPDAQYGENPTNWWVPTLRTMATMMRVAGFERVSAWKIDNPAMLPECRGYAHGFK